MKERILLRRSSPSAHSEERRKRRGAGSPVRRWHLAVGLLALLLVGGCTGGRFAAGGGWSAVVDGGELVYVGTQEGTLLALDAETGIREWQFPQDTGDSVDELGAIYGTPAVADGKAFLGGDNGKVYAVTAGRVEDGGGQKVWQFEVGFSGGIKESAADEISKGVVGSVVIVGDKAIFGAAVNSETGRFYVLNADDGSEECRYPASGTIGKVWSTPTVSDGIAYFGDLDHRLYAVSLEDCSLQWLAPVELGGAIASTPLVAQGRIYVGSFDRSFYAVDASSGQISKLLTAGNWFWGGVATDGRSLFVPSLDGKLYAVNLATGAQLWTPFDTGGAILSTPVVIGSQVVVASDADTLYLLSASNGSVQWSFEIGADVRGPLMAKDGVVYVHAMDRTIHAIDITKRFPVKGWPVSIK